ncbi:MAG: prepilin peptidase [Acidobacteria bacterium]|nr:prepilin peptidase [Acidobacteriota bacterium]
MTVLTAAFHDARSRKIPNTVAVAGFLGGIAAHLHLFGLAGLRPALLGFAAAFALYFVLYLLHAMGAGDVKLMGAVGAIAGFRAWILVLLATLIIGAVAALIMAVSKGRLRSTLWNVGYLIRELASFRAPWLAHEQLDVKHESTLRLPHGLSIAAGAMVSLMLMRGWR